MACAKDTARCDLEYWRKRQDTPLCCIAHLEEIMRDTHAALTACGVDYWLDYGSLLAAVREGGKIIPWDTDLDIGMRAGQWPQLRDAFAQLGQRYYISSGGPSYQRVNYSKTNLVHCDIWIFEPIGAALHCKSLPKDDFPPAWVESRGVRPFVGIADCPVPADPEGFLELRYGERWKIPLRSGWAKK